MVLDLGLQIEDSQRARRREAQEGYARCHVDEQADEEVALADLRRAAQNQHAARRQHARRDDVLGHRAVVIEQRTEREGRYGGDSGRLVAQQGWAIALHMTAPQPVGLQLQPLQPPGRAQHGGVVLADGLPAVVRAQAAVMHQADVVPDRSARALEARPCILPGLPNRRRQHIGDGRLFARGARLHADARHGGHGLDRFGELAEINLDMCTVVADRYQPLEPALVIDAAGHADRLMRRAEMGVAADLDGDVAAQTTERCEVLALGGLR